MVAVLLTSSAAVTLAVSIIGPIGSDHRDSAWERMAFGLLYMGLVWPVFYAQMVMVYYFLRRRSPIAILTVLVLAMLPASVVGSSVVNSVEGIAHPGYAAESAFLGIFLLFSVLSISCALLYFYVVWQRVMSAGPVAGRPENSGRVSEEARRVDDVAAGPAAESATAQPGAESNGTAGAAAVAAGSGAGRDSDAQSRTAPAASAADTEQAAGVRQLVPYRPGGRRGELFRLLPDALGTDLVFIKSEDHYLEVHTTAGSSLIKMRFSDAIAELGDRGIRVHRSYWVATGHVVRAVRTGKRTVLRLNGDHRVPVSVTHLRTVRDLLSG